MKYYIEISSWNLLESFVTESISPFSFYQERDFGNNLSRYLSGEKEKANYLILSTSDLGGDFSICIDEELIDNSLLTPIKGLKTVFTYPKTIYYRQGFVRFRFGSPELRDSLIAESQILLEVKTIEKYSSEFYINDIKNVERKSIAKLPNTLSFQKSEYVEFDNLYNKGKGAVVGYVRGLYTSSDESNQTLQNELRSLKNRFGGYNTQIMMNDTFEKNEEILSNIIYCQKLYFAQIERNNYFDVLVAQLREIENLAVMRANEVKNSDKKDGETENLLAEKTDVENKRTEIEKTYNIYNIRIELNEIKAQEKANGEAIGKTRQYYKKGTPEYERKLQLKQEIEDFEKNNTEYKRLNERLRQIDGMLDVDGNMYDSTISALFSRVSDILNELIKNASSVTNNEEIDLSNILVRKENITIKNEDNDSELCYLNILLDLIFHKNPEIQISEYAIMELLVESANIFKESPMSKTDKGINILNCLRTFWAYKNQKSDQILIPGNDVPIFQSVFSFFVKPLGFEQMERYMLLKKFPQKSYAFMLWGAWIGFADMPKTFTNILYQDVNVANLIDNKLEELYNVKQ